MAFDAGFTAAILHEIAESAVGARIEKIFQPSKESVLLVLRGERSGEGKGQTLRLLIDAGASNPRMGFADPAFDNPKVPPMFCMLLRKHLSGARITSVRQLGFERAAEFEFEGRDELGYLSKKYIYAEIMGKFSNLIFCDADKRVLAAVHTQDLSGGSKRPILPGIPYTPPPPQEGKISPLDETREGFFAALTASGLPHNKFIMSRYAGLSPLVAREIAHLADGESEGLWRFFSEVVRRIREGDFTPTLLLKPDGTPLEYAFLPITQYGSEAVSRVEDSFSRLLETFFAERSRNERIRQRASDILRLLTAAETRLTKKLAAQEADLEVCKEKEDFKKAGDLITANIYRLSRGMTEATLTDYFDEACPEIVIPLDSRLTPAQNAQRYYKKYNKCKSAEHHLTEQMAKAREELRYLDTVFDALTKAETENDLSEIRRELYESGYASRMKHYAAAKLPAPKPLAFTTSGGWKLLVGKNNSQNDYITHKLASKGDIWFHIKDYPGSHAVLFCDGAEPDALDFTEAATIAAVYSKAPAGQKVTVDYTRIRYLKKPPAAKPGFVTFSNNYSAYVTPDRELAERLQKK